MNTMVKSAVVVVVLAVSGAGWAVPGPGWVNDCPNATSGYGMQRGAPGFKSRGQGCMRNFGHRHDRGSRGLKWLMSGLDLTEDQRAQVAEIHDEYRGKMIDQRQQLRTEKHQKIEQVLNDEQREALRERMQSGRGNRNWPQ